MTTPFIAIISPSGFRDILNLNLSGRTIAPLIRMEPSPALGPSTGKMASRLNSTSKEKLLTCCMACALHEETVAASSSMPPGKQSAGRSISPSILDMGSIGAVAVGAGVGVGVGVGVGIGVGVAVDIGVGMAVGVGVGVEKGGQQCKERMDLLELLRKGGMDGDVDFLREALRVLVEGIMDAEVSSRIGAEYGERSPERVTQRNGYRSRAWDTRVGTMDLHIPKLREGSYFPSLLEPRRRSERALLAVIQQAYVEGVSTRRVDDLVKALGCEGISKSQVSRICQELDVVVDGFMGRPLGGGPYPYLWLDALTQKVREAGRIVNVSVVVATAVNGEGKREIIGMDVGTSEDGAFWLAFLRSLSARGLGGVELVVSDAHQGLRGAIAAVFGGASWQRCRTHFMTNLLTRVPRRTQPWVATMVRTIYQQPSPDEVPWALV